MLFDYRGGFYGSSYPMKGRCPSVCLSVTLVSPSKTAEPIEMTFGLRIRVGPRMAVQIPTGRGNFEGEGAAPCKVQ